MLEPCLPAVHFHPRSCCFCLKADDRPWLVPLSVTPSCFLVFLPSGFVPKLANIPTPSSWFGKTMTNLRVTGICSAQFSDNTQTVYRCIQYICWSPLDWDINIILTKTKAIEITNKSQGKPMRSRQFQAGASACCTTMLPSAAGSWRDRTLGRTEL